MILHPLGLRAHAAQHDNPTAFSQVLVSLLRDEQLAASVDGEDPVELLRRDLADVAESLQAGVGDHDVQLAKMGNGLFEQHADFFGLGHVGLDGNCVLPVGLLDLLDDLFGRFGGAGIVDHQRGTAACELECILTAHTPAGAGDQCDFAIQAGGGHC